MKTSQALIVLFSLFFHPLAADAHEAPENSASIIQYEQAVEVRLTVDLLSWVDRMMPIPGSWERAEDVAPRLQLAELNVQQTVLLVDDKRIPLKVVNFPSLQDAMGIHHHHEDGEHAHSKIILRSSVPVSDFSKVSLQLPPELGPAIMSFSQPKTRLVATHAPGIFHVKPEPKMPSAAGYWPQALAVLLGVTAVFGFWKKRS